MEPLLAGWVWRPHYRRFNTVTSCECSSPLWKFHLAMAAPSRPCEIAPVLDRREIARTAATLIVIEGQNEKIRNKNLRRGATRLQQSNANMNGTWERPPPKSSSQPTNPPTEIEETLPSRFEQPSPPAIPAPADTEETTSQALSTSSLSMDASSTTPPELVASTVRPTLTAQLNASTIIGTSTIRAASTTLPEFLVESGAKIIEGVLPGMNQNDPASGTVPGRNQEDPYLVTTSAVTSLAAPKSSLVASSTSAMTVDKPMPGKNQPKPTVDAAAASLTTLSNSSSTVVPSSSIPLSTTSTAISTTAKSPTVALSMAPTLIISTPSSTGSSTTISASVLSPVLTFVTVTRTAQDKGDAQPSTQSVLIPQAVTAPQSLSSPLLMSSLAVSSAIPSGLATTASVEPQGGLTPLARALFILFGVLGFITILLTLGIVWVMRSNKRHAQAAQQQGTRNPVQETGDYNGYGNTTRISTASSIKTFLTESERAIVNRAAMPDRDTDASEKPSNALTDAINSFITKSRRLTYKISP